MKLSLELPLVVLLSHTWFAAGAQDVPILPSASKIAESVPAEIRQSTQAQPLTHAITGPQAASMRSTAGRFGEPVEIVSIDTRKLQAPAGKRADAGGEVLSLNGSAPDPVPLALDIAGSKFLLAWAGEHNDPTRAYRYVTMSVLNHPDAYARFTVMGDTVIGTIVTRDVTYRIFPIAGGQAVYKLSSADKRPAKLKRVAPSSQDVAAIMEQRHVQLEQISDIQPRRADLRDATHLLWIDGGRLGSLSGEVTAARVAKLLRDLGEVSYAPTDLQINVVNVAKNAQGMIVTFRQVLNGIEVLQPNRIETNTAGEVTRISTQLSDDRWAATGQLMSQAEAQALALKAIEARINEPLKQYELTQPVSLFYLLQTPELKLLPFYEFHVQARRTDGLWSVIVNAQSGEARIATNP